MVLIKLVCLQYTTFPFPFEYLRNALRLKYICLFPSYIQNLIIGLTFIVAQCDVLFHFSCLLLKFALNRETKGTFEFISCHDAINS